VDGTKGTGPSLKGVYGKEEVFADGTSGLADENYVRESILYPNRKIVKGYTPAMPTYANSLRDAQLNAIVAYVKSLGENREGADE
jgi:cytochrome c oxidase subunit 2